MSDSGRTMGDRPQKSHLEDFNDGPPPSTSVNYDEYKEWAVNRISQLSMQLGQARRDLATALKSAEDFKKACDGFEDWIRNRRETSVKTMAPGMKVKILPTGSDTRECSVGTIRQARITSAGILYDVEYWFNGCRILADGITEEQLESTEVIGCVDDNVPLAVFSRK